MKMKCEKKKEILIENIYYFLYICAFFINCGLCAIKNELNGFGNPQTSKKWHLSDRLKLRCKSEKRLYSENFQIDIRKIARIMIKEAPLNALCFSLIFLKLCMHLAFTIASTSHKSYILIKFSKLANKLLRICVFFCCCLKTDIIVFAFKRFLVFDYRC